MENKIAAVLIGLGIETDNAGVIVTKNFDVDIRNTEFQDELNNLINKHYPRGIYDLLKIKDGVSIGEQYPEKENKI